MKKADVLVQLVVEPVLRGLVTAERASLDPVDLRYVEVHQSDACAHPTTPATQPNPGGK